MGVEWKEGGDESNVRTRPSHTATPIHQWRFSMMKDHREHSTGGQFNGSSRLSPRLALPCLALPRLVHARFFDHESQDARGENVSTSSSRPKLRLCLEALVLVRLRVNALPRDSKTGLDESLLLPLHVAAAVARRVKASVVCRRQRLLSHRSGDDDDDDNRLPVDTPHDHGQLALTGRRRLFSLSLALSLCLSS